MKPETQLRAYVILMILVIFFGVTNGYRIHKIRVALEEKTDQEVGVENNVITNPVGTNTLTPQPVPIYGVDNNNYSTVPAMPSDDTQVYQFGNNCFFLWGDSPRYVLNTLCSMPTVKPIKHVFQVEVGDITKASPEEQVKPDDHPDISPLKDNAIRWNDGSYIVADDKGNPVLSDNFSGSIPFAAVQPCRFQDDPKTNTMTIICSSPKTWDAEDSICFNRHGLRSCLIGSTPTAEMLK